MSRNGFTMIDLLVTIAIVVLFTTVAAGGTRGLLQSIRFTNTFNKTILMVQSARSMATTGKDVAVNNYKIDFTSSSATSAEETLTLDPTSGFEFFFSDSTQSPCLIAQISFENGTGNPALSCNNQVTFLKVGLQEMKNGNKIRCKEFSIHKAAGIPQINNDC